MGGFSMVLLKCCEISLLFPKTLRMMDRWKKKGGWACQSSHVLMIDIRCGVVGKHEERSSWWGWRRESVYLRELWSLLLPFLSGERMMMTFVFSLSPNRPVSIVLNHGCMKFTNILRQATGTDVLWSLTYRKGETRVIRCVRMRKRSNPFSLFFRHQDSLKPSTENLHNICSRIVIGGSSTVPYLHILFTLTTHIQWDKYWMTSKRQQL